MSTLSNAASSISPIENMDLKLSWRLKSQYYSQDGIKVTVRKAKEDSKAILYCLKTPNGKRFLLQRTSNEIILVSSDMCNNLTKFIACELK